MSMQVRFSYDGREPQVVVFDGSPIMIGSLLSNGVILPIDGVEPIHALIESDASGTWRISDLASELGVIVDGKKIKVVASLSIGSEIHIGTATLRIEAEAIPEGPKITIKGAKPAGAPAPISNLKKPQDSPAEAPQSFFERTRQSLLFSPRAAKPSGDVLEVVAYWGGTILEVEQFHSTFPGFENVYVGDPLKCHFIAAGPGSFDRHKIASVGEDGYRLNLIAGMQARLRKGGEVEEVTGGSHTMGPRDIAHVRYGSVRYFFLFIKPPVVVLPKMGVKDPFFVMLMSVLTTFFLVSTSVLWMANPKELKTPTDDLWGLVHTVEEKKKEPVKKKEVVIEKVTVPPPPELKPPPVKPAKVEPVKPVEKEKPKEPVKPETKTQMTETIKPKDAPKVTKAPEDKVAKGNTGGSRGGAAAPAAGGAVKGNTKTNAKGVAGASTPKPSGVNLSQLGLGVGQISSASGPSAIHTNFKSSAGGAGAGAGSASKTMGLGGVDSSAHSLALSGGGGANNFGSGSNGVLGGQGAQGSPFGQGKTSAAVNIGSGDPVISGGLSESEIMGVIRANLNQVRHCYEALLQRSPNAAGVMKVQFMIGLDGYVTSANISNTTINDSATQGCVLGVIHRWKFNNPRGNSPVKVNYPFSFNSV